VRAFLDRAECEDDLNELREELYRVGYSSRMREYKPKRDMRLKPIEYTTSGGYRVYIGRNNIQNDYITFKLARGGDIWFHAKGAPGSHVVLVCGGEEPSESDYTEAASLAAYYSSMSKSPVVAVDYTRVKNIKRVIGAKPGFVIYKTNYTAYVEPKGI
jgi:predicted ribosome quality control (RQC) complex YloA/Tae2 family protein